MSSANCGSNSRRGKTAANTSTTWGNVTAGAFFSPQAHAHHKEVRQDDQGHMMMPSGPAPDFIIAHPQQLLTVFKARCDGPTHPAHAHMCFHSGVNWRMAQGGLQLPRLDVPPQHQPDVRPWQGLSHGNHPPGGTLCHHGSLTAFLARLTCPGLSG